jgi:hypothetical protein
MASAHDLHRTRRKLVKGFFSCQSATRMEKLLVDKVRLLDSRLEALNGTKTVIRIDHAFSALAGDNIGHISRGAPPRLIEEADFSPTWYGIIPQRKDAKKVLCANEKYARYKLMYRLVFMVLIFRCFSGLHRYDAISWYSEILSLTHST